MDVAELIKLLASGENERVEFKRRITKDAARDVAALLNTEGGYVIFGVDDDGTPIGVDDVDLSAVLDPIEPKPSGRIRTHMLNLEGKKIVVLEVGRSPYIHTYRNVVYVRVGSLSKPLSIEEVVEKASESLLVHFDSMPNPRCSLDELSEGHVDMYMERRAEVRRVKVPALPFEEKLLLIHAATRYGGAVVPTNAGVLFFCENPQRYVPQATVRAVVFRGQDVEEAVDMRIFEGPLWKQIEECADFLRRYIPVESSLSGESFRRTVRRAYPLFALREAIINAVTHRNYFDYGDVRVFVFPDRVEVINPGCFPPGVDPENPIHKPRNPIISQYFYDMGYVERYGMGIRRMRKYCREFGIDGPEFVLREYETRVVFRARPPSDEDVILEMALSRGHVTSRDVMEALGVSRDTANRYLRRLIEAGKLRRVGRGKSTRYVPA